MFVFDLPLSRFRDSGRVYAAIKVTGTGVGRACVLEMTGTRRITESGSGSSTAGIADVPVHIPVNICGNSVGIIGTLNPAVGNLCPDD